MYSKTDPVTIAFEVQAKNLLKSELRRRGITYAGLADKLAAIGVKENARNLNNKLSRGGFPAAFFLQCLVAIGVRDLRIQESD
jgi:hypothetical protein